MAKKKETKGMSPEEKEKAQVQLTVKNVDMINSSIKIAKHLSRIAGCGPEGIMTTMVLVVSDFIEDMASSVDVPKERITNDLLDAIRESVNGKYDHKEGN